MPPQQQYTWQQICLGKNSGNKITVIHSHHARSPLWPQATQNLCCLFPVNHPSFFPFFLSLQSPGLVELGGGERSAVCCLKVSHVLPRLRQREREREREKTCKKAAGMEEEWKMRGVGGQWTKSAELDYISFGLYGSVPYKSLPSLKGLQGRWIKPNSEGITKGGKA